MARGRQDWRTPPSVFKALSKKFGPFTFDAASDNKNALCSRHYVKTAGGPLEQAWGWGIGFINPPFADIMPWVLACMRRLPDKTILLTPANTSSKWFRLAAKWAKLYIPDRRISFWHPDEIAGHPDRDTVVWVFGEEAGRVEEIEIPKHSDEVRRLCRRR